MDQHDVGAWSGTVPGRRIAAARSSATGSSSPTRSTSAGPRRPWCCCRPGRSSTRGSGRPRCPTWPGTSGWSPSTAGAAGRSGRPVGAAAYADGEYAADTLAVLDATGTDRAVLVGFSCGVAWSVHVAAAGTPSGSAASSRSRPSCGLAIGEPGAGGVRLRRAARHHPGLGEVQQSTTGCAGGYDGLPASSSSAQMFPEPHSTKQIEDCVGWATADRLRRDPGRTPPPAGWACTAPSGSPWSRCAPSVTLPGARGPRHRGPDPAGRDRRRLAELTGGDLVAARGRRARAAGPRAGARSTTSIREFAEQGRIRRPSDPHLGPGAAAAAAGALPVLADRARPRPARRGDRRRAARAPPGPRRSTGWPRTR